MPPRPIQAIIFDWDGTLADSAEASYRTYVRTFVEFGIPFDRAEYERTYSPNWYHTFRCVGLPQERWHDADARWLAHYAEERVGLCAGAREVLESVASRGIVQAIVTSGSRDRVSRELTEHGIAQRFRHLIGGDDAANRKPHPEALHICLDRLGVSAEHSVYVGDSPEDVMMAKAAGVYSVAIPGGFPNRAALAAAGPDLFAGDLVVAIGRLLEADA